MLDDVGIRILAGIVEGLFPFDQALVAIRHSLGADNALGNAGGRFGRVPAHAGDARAVGILHLNGEVIPDVSGDTAAVLPSTHAVKFHRRAAKRPVDHIEIVQVLLDDLVAAEPVPVIPVPALPLEVAELGEVRILRIIFLAEPDAVAVPITVAGHQLADVATVDPLHRLDVTRLMAALRARDHGQLLLLRQARRLDYRANADGIHRHRFFDKHVLSRRDRRRKMQRTESGRGREDHHVDTGREDFLIGVETREALHVGQLQLLLRGLDLPGKQVAQRHDLDARGGIQAVLGRGRTAPTAADDADPDAVGSRHGTIHPRGIQPGQDGGTGGDRGQFHKITARNTGDGRNIHGDGFFGG